MNFPKVCVFLAALGLSTTAAAEATDFNNGWYLGGYIGNASVKVKAPGSVLTDESDFVSGPYLGYAFNSMFSLEGNILLTDNLAGVNRPDLSEAWVLSMSFTPKFSYQVAPKVALYGKVGLALVDYYEEYVTPTYPKGENESWLDLAFTYGLGAQFDISNNIKMRVEYDVINADLENAESLSSMKYVDLDMDRTLVGLHYQF